MTWKDNFDSFYSEVAELGRYDVKPRTPSTEGRVLAVSRLKTELPLVEETPVLDVRLCVL